MANTKPTTREERPRLSTILPPLIFGTATFNHQYNRDPYALDTTGLVQQAVYSGIRAFDTSPYYGPAEELLGDALDTALVRETCDREDYYLLTKVGRVAEAQFDYSAKGIRKSIQRSLDNLRTDYLDVVYCHDVEFVSQEEALSAIKELRKMRDKEGTVKYIGISGYPVKYLCRLAKRVLRETGEPLDIVMSYANCTLQNDTLVSEGVQRLKDAGVDVVPNASPLGMGLLRSVGPPIGLTDFHPAGAELRLAIESASDFCDSHGESLETVAIRYALETWITEGSSVGSSADPASGLIWQQKENEGLGGKRLGVSVIGVSTHPELTKTLQIWRSILDGVQDADSETEGKWKKARDVSLSRQAAVNMLAEGIREELGSWVNYAWPSPPPGFVKLGRRSSSEEEPTPWRSESNSPALRSPTSGASSRSPPRFSESSRTSRSPRSSPRSPRSPRSSGTSSTTLTPSPSDVRLSERMTEKLRADPDIRAVKANGQRDKLRVSPPLSPVESNPVSPAITT